MRENNETRGVPPVDDAFVPPIFQEPEQRTIEPDPPRGALTEGKDLVAAFAALALEGKAAMYKLFRSDGLPVNAEPSDRVNMLADLTAEEHGVLGYPKSFAYAQRAQWPGTRELYGYTYHRVTRQFVWAANVIRVCTDQEVQEGCFDCGRSAGNDPLEMLKGTVRWWKKTEMHGREPFPEEMQRFRVERYGLPDMCEQDLLDHYKEHPLPGWFRKGMRKERYDATGPEDERFPAYSLGGEFRYFEKTSLAEVYQRWVEEYAEEVRICAVHFADHPGIEGEINRLYRTLSQFEIGQGEGDELVENLGQRGVGRKLLAAMQDGKERLLEQLKALVEGLSRANDPAPPALEPIKWKGTLQQLGWVLRELAEKDWIEAPRHKGNTSRWKDGDINSSALAKVIGPHFKEVNLVTLQQELKKEGGSVPAQDVEGWSIPGRSE